MYHFIESIPKRSFLLKVDFRRFCRNTTVIDIFTGIITVGLGMLLIFFMPADPTVTRLLNENERALALARIDADQVVKMGGRKEPTSLKLIIRSFNINVFRFLLGR